MNKDPGISTIRYPTDLGDQSKPVFLHALALAKQYDSAEGFSPVKEVLVVGGKPSEEILRVAEEDKADMIVMGKSTRKVRGIRVMGSTARRVSRIADIAVLVVPNC